MRINTKLKAIAPFLLVLGIFGWLSVQSSAAKFNRCLFECSDTILASKWEESSLAKVMSQYLTLTQRDRVIKEGLRYSHLSRFEILDYIRESIKEELLLSGKVHETCSKKLGCHEYSVFNSSFVLCRP